MAVDVRVISSLEKVFLDEELRAPSLAGLTSHEEAVALMESEGEITFSQYPHAAEWLLTMRERINRRIQQVLEN